MPPQQPWGSRGYSAARPCPVAAPCGAALACNVGGLNAALRGLVATQSPQLTEQPAGPIPGTAQTVVLCLFEADFGAGQPPSTRPARFEFACATGEAARSALVDSRLGHVLHGIAVQHQALPSKYSLALTWSDQEKERKKDLRPSPGVR